MSLKHLSDNELQEYLDGNISNNVAFIQQHLESCPQCREALAQYQTLYLRLKDESEFQLSGKFKSSVIARLQRKEARPTTSLVAKILTAAGLIFAIVISFFIFDMKPFLKPIYEPFTDFFSRSSITSIFSGISSSLNGNYTLILSSILVFMIIALIDRIAIRRISRL